MSITLYETQIKPDRLFLNLLTVRYTFYTEHSSVVNI